MSKSEAGDAGWPDEFVKNIAQNVAQYILVNIFLKVAQAGERTWELLISFIFSFHHFTAKPQRLPTF
jgi:hypothetical protein